MKWAASFLVIAGAVAASLSDVAVPTDTWLASDILVLNRGRPVNQIIGPEAAVYCKLTDPTQQVVFDGFGRCNLALDRVTNSHAGIWIMNIGTLDNLLTTEYRITAEVRGSGDKPIVTTFVEKEQPVVTLKCSVPVEYDVKSCLFQDPSGRAILASEGVSQDRYTFTGTGTTVSAGVSTHECGLLVSDPQNSDLGLWRCAVQTENDVYYGFLTVLCPWAMMDPTVAAAVVSEPTLTAAQTEISHMEGDSLTMSCSIQSPIKYCYFRRPNGMTFSVAPGISTDEYEYVGAGLDAGECGIKFTQLLSQEAGHWPEGRWSCHVGLPDRTEQEQRVTMQVQINRPIEVNQQVSGTGLLVEGTAHNGQVVEYCRYVRIDGLGFTSATLPDSRYSSSEVTSRGHCGIFIQSPTILDMHPWTIAAKIVNIDQEVLGVTTHTIQIPGEPGTPEGNDNNNNSNSNIWWWCLLGIVGGIVVITAGVLFIPTKNRRNTIARASSWRESIRRSFREEKKPLPEDLPQHHNSPMSA